LVQDADLEVVARRAIRSIALSGAPLSRSAQDEAVRTGLEASGLKSAVAEAFVGSSPEEAGMSRNATDGSWTRWGVGAIYASSPAYGPGRLWVLILFAR
jgi:hypothetical protein